MGEFLVRFFLFAGACFVCSIFVCAVSEINNRKKEEKEIFRVDPFIASKYLERIEKAGLEILERQEQIDKIIVLWWGLDGLRLNKDGTLEWISRKKPEPVNQNVFYQPMQWIAPLGYHPYMPNMFQNIQAQISPMTPQIEMLQMQAAQMAQNAQIANGINVLNSQCCTQNVLFY